MNEHTESKNYSNYLVQLFSHVIWLLFSSQVSWETDSQLETWVQLLYWEDALESNTFLGLREAGLGREGGELGCSCDTDPASPWGALKLGWCFREPQPEAGGWVFVIRHALPLGMGRRGAQL